MGTISKRVSKYLIARQQRAARLNAFGKALDAGILERTLLGETEHSGEASYLFSNPLGYQGFDGMNWRSDWYHPDGTPKCSNQETFLKFVPK